MRDTKTITLIDDDKEKTFEIKQMAASKAERWLFKLILLIGGNANVENLQDMGGFLSAVADKPYERVEELLNELLSCVSHVTDGGIRTQMTPAIVDDHVKEMNNLMKLQMEAFSFNNFFPKSGTSALNESPAPAVTIKKAK